MDLINIKPSERIIEILDPKTEEELGIKITLLSINDVKLKKIKRQIQDQRLHLEARGKNFKAVDIEDNGYKLIFSAMTGWIWGKDVSFNGDDNPAFNQKVVTEVLTELPWFKDQLEEAIGDEKAFFSG